MAHSMLKRFGGALAVSASLVASLAMMPGVALAADYTTAPVTDADTAIGTDETGKGKLTVNGIEGDNATVSIYRFIETTYDADTNSVNTRVADDFSSMIPDLGQFNDSNVASVADRLAALIEFQSIDAYATDSSSADGYVFDNLPYGEYLILVSHENGGNSAYVYQNTIVNYVPEVKDNTYMYDAEQSVEIKRDDVGTDFSNPTGNNGKKVKDDGSWAELSDDYADGADASFYIGALLPDYAADAETTNKTLTITDELPTGLTGFKNVKVVWIDSTDQPQEHEISNPSVTYFDGEGGQTTDAGTARKMVVDLSGSAYEAIVEAASEAQTEAVSVRVYFDSTVGTLTPNTPVTNTATLDFSSNPFVTDEGGHAEDTAQVRNYGVFLQKVTENGVTPLSGATFQLMKDGQAVDGKTVVSDADGYVWFTGLAEGSYSLKETKAPNGYAVPTEDTTSAKAVNSSVSTDSFTDAASTEHSQMVSFGTFENAKATLGNMLPTTGGTGTIALTAAGVVLVAGAAALIVRARRNEN